MSRGPRRPKIAPPSSVFATPLPATADTSGLLELEKRMIAAAKAERNNAVQHLRLGFLSLRIGELGGQSHYDDAASEFQWAIDLEPKWPYAWYGMGLAEYGVGDSQVSFVTGLKTMLGKDALTRSAVAFAKSAEVDPAFVRGLVDLANTALRQRVNIKLGVALDALRRAGNTPARDDPEVMLARGRVEREVGDGDSALVALPGLSRARAQQGPWRARGGSHAVPARALRRCGALLRGRRLRRLDDGGQVTAPTSPRSPATACCASSTRCRVRGGWRTCGSSGASRDRAELGRRRAAPGALPPDVLRAEEFPAHVAQPALRYRRAISLGQPGLR